MDDTEFLAQRFEEHRAHLRAAAYRMLGSVSEADDAVQEAWLRLSRTDAAAVENLGAWLTTVVARISLNMLRSRGVRSEQPFNAQMPEPIVDRADGVDPEHEALLADSVGLALLVVLDTLNPAERLAFVLHDLFGIEFDEIAGIVGWSPEATRQLASRARRRVQKTPTADSAELGRQRAVVERFLAALRAGDVPGLISVLDPDVVVNGAGAAGVIRGAEKWAKAASHWSSGARNARAALLDGKLGIVLAPKGKLLRALELRFVDDTIVEVEIISDPARLAALEIGVVD